MAAKVRDSITFAVMLSKHRTDQAVECGSRRIVGYEDGERTEFFLLIS